MMLFCCVCGSILTVWYRHCSVDVGIAQYFTLIISYLCIIILCPNLTFYRNQENDNEISSVWWLHSVGPTRREVWVLQTRSCRNTVMGCALFVKWTLSRSRKKPDGSSVPGVPLSFCVVLATYDDSQTKMWKLSVVLVRVKVKVHSCALLKCLNSHYYYKALRWPWAVDWAISQQ